MKIKPNRLPFFAELIIQPREVDGQFNFVMMLREQNPPIVRSDSEKLEDIIACLQHILEEMKPAEQSGIITNN